MSDERGGNSTLGHAARGKGTALLVIDVQQGLFAKPTPIHRGDELLATIGELIQRAHRTLSFQLSGAQPSRFSICGPI